MTTALSNRRILLIISGGIAAYKSLELIRKLRQAGAAVRCVLTQGGAQFVTPLSVAALSEDRVYSDLWSLTDEAQMGHIRLSREADLVLVAPASANLIAQMAHGLAQDLASTVLLATDKPVMIAPAMNVMMWQHAATQANITTLHQRGIALIGPDTGEMACGEEGAGRMSEVTDIIAAVEKFFARPGPLANKHVLITSGPTYEPIDPVRFIGNRSSGKQGLALAQECARQGAAVTLVTGPTHLPDPEGVRVIPVQTAQEMLQACESALPADIAICAAAVGDWRVAETASGKMKKTGDAPSLQLVENPDILATLSQAGTRRPKLVIGFAAETENLAANAAQKLEKKKCDWLLANDVSDGQCFDQEDNQVTLFRRETSGKIITDNWPRQSKTAIARQVVGEIIAAAS